MKAASKRPSLAFILALALIVCAVQVNKAQVRVLHHHQLSLASTVSQSYKETFKSRSLRRIPPSIPNPTQNK